MAGKAAFAAGDGTPRNRHHPEPALSAGGLGGGRAAPGTSRRLLRLPPVKPRKTRPPATTLFSRGLDDPELWQRFGIGFSDRTLGLRIPRAKTANRVRNCANACKPSASIGPTAANTSTAASPSRSASAGRTAARPHRPALRAAQRPESPQGKPPPLSAKTARRHLQPRRPGTQPRDHPNRKLLDALTFIRTVRRAAAWRPPPAPSAPRTSPPNCSMPSAPPKSKASGSPSKPTRRAKSPPPRPPARLQAIGIECHRVKLPWGMDANQYALEQGGEALRQAVRSAEWIDARRHSGGTRRQRQSSAAPKSEASKDSESTVITLPSLAAKSSAAKEGKGPEQAPPSRPDESRRLPRGRSSGRGSTAIGGLEKNNWPGVAQDHPAPHLRGPDAR